MNKNLINKGGLFPALVTSLASILLMFMIFGKSGLIGSLLASVIVLIFFVIQLFVIKISRELDPMLALVFAMFAYFAKLIFLGVLLLLVTRYSDESTVDRGSFAISAIAITIMWLLGEIRGFLKLRLTLPLPKISEENYEK